MKNHAFILFISLLFWGGGVSAQLTSNGTSCADFEYACGGGDAFFPDGQIDVTCDKGSRTFDIPGRGNEICWRDFLCRRGGSACLRYKNWHFCQNGNGAVYQSLPRNSSINGVILGNFPLEAGGGTGLAPCVGVVYPEFNNTINSPTEINICPGDPAILKVPGLEFPAGYSGLLEFNIRRVSNNSLVYFNFFDANDINADDEIDISLPFNFLSSDLYIFELIMGCFSGLQGCPGNQPNRVKKSYVQVINDVFSADANYAVGGWPPNCGPFGAGQLSTQSDGIVLDIPDCSDPFYNPNYTLILNNIENAGGDPITWELFFKNCNDPGDFSSFGEFTIPAATVATGDVSLGSPPIPDLSECTCYRLDITYTDICASQGTTSTTSKYYRIGNSCSEFTSPTPGEGSKFRKAATSTEQFQLFPNPMNDYFLLTWDDIPDDQAQLIIFNGTGQLVREIIVPTKGSRELRVDIDFPQGAYYYKIVSGSSQQAGTFIKE